VHKKNLKGKLSSMTSDQLIKWLAWIFVSAVLVVAAVFLFYLLHFQGGLTVEHERWGTFGDFVGGTLNPILSFLALTSLLLTIVLQNRELEATREEMSQSRIAAQEQVSHFKNESKKADVYKTIHVLEDRLEKLYREPIYFTAGNELRERELYFVLSFATDDALQQIIKPEEHPPAEYETQLVKTKSLLMQLHLTIVKLSMQLTMLTEFRDNNAILFFYEPTIGHLASKLDKIGYLPPDDRESLKINAEIRGRAMNAQNQMA
tara:strand:+ start:12974 stop:13759 length:786 start_codon:yes stop_codon:yes gene_type:complete